MSDWLLMIVTLSFNAVGALTVEDVRFQPMPEAQCRAVIQSMRTLYGRVGLACIGPQGQLVELEQVAE